jgi:hypothetical protein
MNLSNTVLDVKRLIGRKISTSIAQKKYNINRLKLFEEMEIGQKIKFNGRMKEKNFIQKKFQQWFFEK